MDPGLKAHSLLLLVLQTHQTQAPTLEAVRGFTSPIEGSEWQGQGQPGQKRMPWAWGTHLLGGSTPAPCGL